MIDYSIFLFLAALAWTSGAGIAACHSDYLYMHKVLCTVLCSDSEKDNVPDAWMYECFLISVLYLLFK